MTPTLVSLIGLTVGFLLMVLWVWNPRTSARWEEASRLPFAKPQTNHREGYEND
ncbi:MAG: cbb3-type cytochrome oxidase subunit 3 [Pseudomonadales bacterium]